MNQNWIAIYDASKDGRVVYTSDSITECTQFTQEEMVGQTGYSFFHPEETDGLSKVHAANVLNERLFSMTTYRHRCKDGSYIVTDTISIYCYDLLLACHYVYEEGSIHHKLRVSAIDEWYFCPPQGGPVQKVATWKVCSDPSITRDHIWNGDNRMIKPQEKRASLVLNRFTDRLDIVYATHLAQEVLGVDPVKLLGRSVYEFLPEMDRIALQTQVNIAKDHNMLFRFRADWIIDKEKSVSEQVEGIACCTNDGILMVVRLAPRVILKL